MPTIILTTIVDAPIERVFDLARSIDLHKISTAKTKEEAVAGKTSGLIGLNETVTWQAIHFGIRQKLTSKITAFTRPFHFRDEQLKGAFKYFIHDHYFKTEEGKIVMTDSFEFSSPGYLLGKIADKIILTRYLTNLLRERNALIKLYAETESWQQVHGFTHS